MFCRSLSVGTRLCCDFGRIINVFGGVIQLTFKFDSWVVDFLGGFRKSQVADRVVLTFKIVEGSIAGCRCG